jgi:hypothetical protein
VCKILLAHGADARIMNNYGDIASDLIPNVDSDKGRELYEYLKSIEEERAELEMTFKRAHVEKEEEEDDVDEEEETEKEEV